MKITLSLHAIILSAVLCSGASGEENRIWIPLNGMEIRFNSSSAAQIKGQFIKDRGKYELVTSGPLMLTLFVEKPEIENGKNADVQEFYWKGAKKNPMIDQSNVKIDRESKEYVRVDYVIVAEDKGKKYRFMNTNFYFVCNRKWVDLHVSYISGDAAENTAEKSEFEKTLKIIAP